MTRRWSIIPPPHQYGFKSQHRTGMDDPTKLIGKCVRNNNCNSVNARHKITTPYHTIELTQRVIQAIALLNGIRVLYAIDGTTIQ